MESLSIVIFSWLLRENNKMKIVKTSTKRVYSEYEEIAKSIIGYNYSKEKKKLKRLGEISVFVIYNYGTYIGCDTKLIKKKDSDYLVE